MKRILVDFNTVMQDTEHGNRVTLGTDEEMNSGEIPDLCPGERVVAYDDEMTVVGTVEHTGGFWLAALDWDTLQRLASAS